MPPPPLPPRRHHQESLITSAHIPPPFIGNASDAIPDIAPVAAGSDNLDHLSGPTTTAGEATTGVSAPAYLLPPPSTLHIQHQHSFHNNDNDTTDSHSRYDDGLRCDTGTPRTCARAAIASYHRVSNSASGVGFALLNAPSPSASLISLLSPFPVIATLTAINDDYEQLGSTAANSTSNFHMFDNPLSLFGPVGSRDSATSHAVFSSSFSSSTEKDGDDNAGNVSLLLSPSTTALFVCHDNLYCDHSVDDDCCSDSTHCCDAFGCDAAACAQQLPPRPPSTSSPPPNVVSQVFSPMLGNRLLLPTSIHHEQLPPSNYGCCSGDTPALVFFAAAAAATTTTTTMVPVYDHDADPHSHRAGYAMDNNKIGNLQQEGQPTNSHHTGCGSTVESDVGHSEDAPSPPPLDRPITLLRTSSCVPALPLTTLFLAPPSCYSNPLCCSLSFLAHPFSSSSSGGLMESALLHHRHQKQWQESLHQQRFLMNSSLNTTSDECFVFAGYAVPSPMHTP